MVTPAMLDLIAKEKRKTKEEIIQEYAFQELVTMAEECGMNLENFIEAEIERRMKVKHPLYKFEGPFLRSGRGHKGCRH